MTKCRETRCTLHATDTHVWYVRVGISDLNIRNLHGMEHHTRTTDGAGWEEQQISEPLKWRLNTYKGKAVHITDLRGTWVYWDAMAPTFSTKSAQRRWLPDKQCALDRCLVQKTLQSIKMQVRGSLPLYADFIYYSYYRGHAVALWFRHYATSRKVVSSLPY
jgi:hypothetical protein